MKTIVRFLIIAAAPLLGGCVYTSYTDLSGRKLTRVSVFGNQSIGKIDLTKGTMEGYTSEQAQIAGAVVEAAVKAAVKP